MSVRSALPSRRLALGGGAALVLVVAGAGAASAHVHAIPETTASGSFSKVTFRVPTESETAKTTKVVVTLPTDTPFTYVGTMPVPGWTATVAEATLPKPVDVGGATITKAPRTVTWTAAAGGGTGPGEFQEFALSVGPLPAAGTDLVLPATQTYSDGQVVAWDQPTPASGEEPENPAPSFEVTAATGGDDDALPSAAVPAAASGSDHDTTALWLGGAGLALGVVGLGLGGTALARTRRPSPAEVTRSDATTAASR